jgi:dihydropteroate synthase
VIGPRPRFAVPLPDGRSLRLGERTLVMGVLNVTPDSFSDGGAFDDPGRAVDAALAMAEAGADLIDVGGESTRPDAEPVEADEEIRRVVPVIEAFARQSYLPVSIDTYKAPTAEAALDAGATIVNDVSGLRADPDLARLVAARRAGLVLMHHRGRSADMYRHAHYDSVVVDVARELGEGLEIARRAGVPEEAVILDPGLGFAKRAQHSLEVLAALDAAPLRALGRPLLVGPSRKSFLEAALGAGVPPPERDWATAAAVTAAILLGAHVVRVHRVPEMVQVARVADMIRAAREHPAG